MTVRRLVTSLYPPLAAALRRRIRRTARRLGADTHGTRIDLIRSAIDPKCTDGGTR